MTSPPETMMSASTDGTNSTLIGRSGEPTVAIASVVVGAGAVVGGTVVATGAAVVSGAAVVVASVPSSPHAATIMAKAASTTKNLRIVMVVILP